jgi:hypothetical protein
MVAVAQGRDLQDGVFVPCRLEVAAAVGPVAVLVDDSRGESGRGVGQGGGDRVRLRHLVTG